MEAAHSHFRRAQGPSARWWFPGAETIGSGYFPVPAPMLAEGGFAYPGGRVTGNPWDTWDFDTTTNLNTVTDMTAAVQAAHDALATTGLGGTIVLGPGVWRINGVNLTAAGVGIRGAGWGEYQGAFGQYTPARRAKLGTYVLTDNTSVPAFTVGSSGNCQITDLGFIQVHPPDAPGWAPRQYQPSILIAGAASIGGSVMCARLLFWGTWQGIQVGSASTTAGRITLKDIALATYSGFVSSQAYGGIQVNACDDAIIDNVNFLPQLLQGNSNQQSYIQSNAYAIIVGTAKIGDITNVSVFNALAGVGLYGSYAAQGGVNSSRLRLIGIDCEGCGSGLVENGTNVGAQVVGLSVVGQNTSGEVAILAQGTSAVLDVVDMYATNFYGSILNCTSATADIRFGMNCRYDNWNRSATAAPALNAVGGAVIYYSSRSRFTNGGGAAVTGGGGTFTAY